MRSEYNKFVSKHIKKELAKGKSPTSAMKAVAKTWQASKKKAVKSRRSSRSKKTCKK